MLFRRAVTLFAAATLAGAASGGPAHEHGAARLDVAVENNRVMLYLDTPLDNLLGFEHAPRSDAERQKADAVVARLKAPEGLFRIDPAGGCTPATVVLNAAALGLGPMADAADGKDSAHADLEAQYSFDCKTASRAGFVELALFEAFPALKRVDLQVISAKGQMKVTLRRPQTRVALVR